MERRANKTDLIRQVGERLDWKTDLRLDFI
jgi:hypothetical protein